MIRRRRRAATRLTIGIILLSIILDSVRIVDVTHARVGFPFGGATGTTTAVPVFLWCPPSLI